MCVLCFSRVNQSDLNITSDGRLEDVCRNCAKKEIAGNERIKNGTKTAS
jgi:hypothetical protein